MRKVAVIFGGKSCENEISILTGVFVLQLLQEKYDVLPVYVHTDGGMYTSSKMLDVETFKKRKYSGFERVFFDGGVAYALGKRKIKRLGRIEAALNCCHGGLGEGGGVSAMMEWNGIPLASPDLVSSGIFLDKYLTKLIARSLCIPVVDYIRVNEKDYEKRGAFLLKTVASRLKYPVVVKPAHLGSSIGIAVAKDEKELKEALACAFELDGRVIVEKYLDGKEDVNCAAYALRGEIVVSEAEKAFGGGIYSFEEKYVKRTADGKGGNRRVLSGELRDKIRSYTRTLYKRMDLKGLVRMDFLLHKGKAYLCEVNTVPGSLAYYLFCDRISDAKSLFFELIEDACERAKEEKKIISTGILDAVERRRK